MPGYVHQRAEVAIKWISTFVIALLLLACLTHSKISLLVLSSAMHASNDNLGRDARCRLFVMLQIISVVPHVINLIRGVWKCVLRRDRKWPKGKVMVLATIMSIMEAVCLCLYIFYIPGLGKPYHAVLLMNCVIFFPLFDTILNIRRLNISTRHLQQYCCCKYTSVYALICVVVGIVCTIILLLHSSIKLPVLALISVMLLSVAWCPSIQKKMVESEKEINTESRRNDGPCASSSSIQYEDSPYSLGQTNDQNTFENTTWKLTALMSLVKLLSTVGCSMLILFVSDMSLFPENFEKVDIDTYKNAWITLFECSRKQFIYFYTHIASGFVGYLVGFIACTTNSHKFGFSLPLAVATPFSMCLLAFEVPCGVLLLPDNEDKMDCTITSSNSKILVVIATAAFFLAQAFSTWWILFESVFNIMLKEDQLFWTPMYNSALLEHWIMLARRNEITDNRNRYLQPLQTAKNSKVFICTTMYREDDEEMKQLLESFRLFNNHAFRTKGLKIEFHIFFDCAVKAGKPTEYLLQLVVLFEKVFGTKVGFFTKMETPYGLSLSLRLPCNQTEGSNCTIHLKDKLKVKSKKRWSQVMYMKYALHETLQANQNSEQSYILTTDGDVKFTPKSVEALINLMARDESVGAVCARTHPLGSGLLVWLQIFEYAIGHWFQKAAEHVLGTVLCAPGCFSVYRLKAINDVLSLFATNVEKAEEFLTKDMGEDRWLCTLLVQKGWLIKYCATSTNSTHCPEDFDQLFKQRRRWIVSTLANQWLLIKEWNLIKQNNLRVSFLFKIYQIVLLVSTLIGPSSVILVVSGGLKFGTDWNPSVSLPIQVILSVCYGIICVNSSSRTQLLIGKLYCCLYTLFMMIALVGTVVKIATDISGQPDAEKNFISEDLKFSSTSVYLIGIAAIFFITAVLHLSEVLIIFYGFVYLLGLPSSYLILMIYSICNITDSSWGTREDGQGTLHGYTWNENILSGINFLCSCFSRQDNRQQEHESENEGTDKSFGRSRYRTRSTGTTIFGDNTMELNDCVVPMQSEEDESVEKWLQDMPEEAKLLKENGFEKTSFISNIVGEDLKNIGLKDRTKIKKILNMVEQLKDYEIRSPIPENVESWLKQIGLEQYKNNFYEANYKDQNDLESLADCNEDDVKSFHIIKRGHIRRFLIAKKALQKPSHAQTKQDEACYAIETLISGEQNSEVIDFWRHVREDCLRPRSTVFESDEHLKVKLKDLRNTWLIVFAMINVLWLILIATLADKGKLLGVFGSNPIGFAVIAVYGAVLILQFFAMIEHRFSTFLHFLGIVPNLCGKAYHSNFVFYDSDIALEGLDNERFETDIGECHRIAGERILPLSEQIEIHSTADTSC